MLLYLRYSNSNGCKTKEAGVTIIYGSQYRIIKSKRPWMMQKLPRLDFRHWEARARNRSWRAELLSWKMNWSEHMEHMVSWEGYMRNCGGSLWIRICHRRKFKDTRRNTKFEIEKIFYLQWDLDRSVNASQGGPPGDTGINWTEVQLHLIPDVLGIWRIVAIPPFDQPRIIP